MKFLLGFLLAAASLTSATVQLFPKDPIVSLQLYADLEELARLVDIAYCVGSTSLGIASPFRCLSRCAEFPAFELVTTFNTGLLFSDSCGYIALDHDRRRIIVAFRGTYSLVDTIVDLSTIPQEYVPFPGNGDSDKDGQSDDGQQSLACNNCTVHAGFYSSWLSTRSIIVPYLQANIARLPGYKLHLVGHSLGGAIAALAGLDFLSRNWSPTVTTFGEPRIGNAALNRFLDDRFGLKHSSNTTSFPQPTHGPEVSDKIVIGVDHLTYRRVTHINDPVPLLPPRNVIIGDYSPHAGEIFISSSAPPPELSSVRHCEGDSDINCSSSQDNHKKPEEEPSESERNPTRSNLLAGVQHELIEARAREDPWWDGGLPPERYRFWQLFWAHREYFVKIGLCIPGGEGILLDEQGHAKKFDMHEKTDL
ncbi:alpha/beta-hydrolase [Dissoconium aciculare CBS 342.82]|uniref:Alpha/beta-hydrolase n=1 Tax=Dissoconium aciculare CBS 342.82 TaxID=1314786 RepID=A0A6J3M8J3_9PEZI|nr:alpha/beta-hydrolase [Dissoconium aciculare CBS 342.82]KAF1824193.1 alpha/beta-hydrolase [Dissoconium aciculare CBS 342.82]